MPAPADVAHLLRRAGFGGTGAEIATLAAQPWETTVEQLLDVSGAPADDEPAYLTEDESEWKRAKWLQQRWLDRMATSPTPLQEKMALFWHGHFTSSQDKVNKALLMHRQIALYRAEGLGRLRPLAQAMAVEPAMLRYLDNDPNTENGPNENFARELMELFLLGVNEYGQDDVVAAARAWTGHNLDDDDCTVYRFYPGRHDDGDKTFMGVTRDWDGPEIIDHLLAGDPTLQRTAARFVADEIWSFLVHPGPDEAVLDALTDVFVASDLDVTELLRAIFLRPEFVSDRAKRGLVRSPIEWVAAGLKATGISASEANPQWWMHDMGQAPLYPPNVSGWRPNGYWLSATALLARSNYARHLTWKVRHDGFLYETLEQDVPAAVQTAFEAFGIVAPSAVTRGRLEQWLADQRADDAWHEWEPVNLTTLLLLSPDFNLA